MSRRLLLLPLSVLALLLMQTQTVSAQAVVGPADAARVRERMPQAQILQPNERLIEVQGPSVAAAPAGAEKVTLILKDLTLDGMTIYQVSEVSSLYSGKIGEKITVADVYQIAADLTRKYRNDGFILTQVVVPPQTIDAGNVRLQVVEGVVGDIKVEGDLTDSERKLITAYAGQVKGEPLNSRKLEQAVLLINDLPGVSARSIISPSASEPGAADLRVLVERKRYEGLASLDNFGSRFLGPVQGQLSLSGNSLLGMHDRLTTDLIFAPSEEFGKELAYGDIVYNQPVGPYGTRIELLASLASSDPGYTLEQFDVNGRSVTYSVKIDQPVIRTRGVNWNLYALFDARNNSTQSNIDSTRKDFIRALRLGTEFNRVDRFLGAGYNTLNVEIAKGLNVFGSSDKGDANLSRAAGDPQFTKLEAEAQRLQRITGNVNLLLGVRGQFSNDAMLSSEEFGVGGPRYGRGYDPSEIVGDDGVAGKLELQVNDPVETNLVKTYQVYAFLDGGRVWNDDATTPADEEIGLLSTGLGVRTTLHTETEAGLYVALPLTHDVQTLGNQDPRLFFNLSQRF